MDAYLGIDPGAKGGMALWADGWSVYPLTMSTRDTWCQLCQWVDGREVVAALETVFPTPGSASSLKLGSSYGRLEGMLVAAGIRYRLVRPTRWQSEFSMHRRKKEPDRSWKGRLRTVAQGIAPELDGSLTFAVSDAVLIAEWVRRQQ